MPCKTICGDVNLPSSVTTEGLSNSEKAFHSDESQGSDLGEKQGSLLSLVSGKRRLDTSHFPEWRALASDCLSQNDAKGVLAM